MFLLVVALGGAFWWWRGHSSGLKYQYETTKILRGDVTSRVTATGNLAPVTKVTVGSEVSGVILKILVDYNSHVRKGQVLAEIDPTFLQTTIAQNQANLVNFTAACNQAVSHEQDAFSGVRSAEAGIATAQASIKTAEATLAGGRAGVVGARAQVARYRAEYVNTLRNYQRYVKLLKKDLVARTDVDAAETTYLVARATLEAQQATLATAMATLRSGQAGVDAARSNLEAARVKRESAVAQLAQARGGVRAAQALEAQARATLEASRVQLQKSVIRSPVDGIVLDRKVNPGQTVQASYAAPELFVLAENLDVMRLETAVDESDVGRVKEGARATFTVDAYPGETFEGRVTQVRQSPQAPQSAASTAQSVVVYTAIVETTNEGYKLKPGMTATVKIDVEQRKNVLLIPNAALRFKPPDEPDKDKSGRSPGPGSSLSVSPSPSASAAVGGKGKPPDRTRSVWVVSPTNPVGLVVKTVTIGITDGTNTELLKSPFRQGDEVVVAAEDVSSKKTTLRLLR